MLPQHQHPYPAPLQHSAGAYPPFDPSSYQQQVYGAAGSGVAAASQPPPPPLPAAGVEEGEIQQPSAPQASGFEVAEQALRKRAQTQLQAAPAGQSNGVQQVGSQDAAPPLPVSPPPVAAQDTAAAAQPGSRPGSAQGASKPPAVIKTNRPLLNIQRRPAK